jgi:cytidine deaminase
MAMPRSAPTGQPPSERIGERIGERNGKPMSQASRAAPAALAAAPTAAQLHALFAAARAVRKQAYAPYSKFLVGAAVLDAEGRVHAGCNVEVAAYPQGWCAEASALAAMVAAGGRAVSAVAVAAVSRQPTTPCGGCRQKLAEFAAPGCVVHVLGPVRQRAQYKLDELLPHGFGPAHLRRKA